MLDLPVLRTQGGPSPATGISDTSTDRGRAPLCRRPGTRGELMAVKMRLMRMGKTKSPHYRVVVMDGRAPRDGRYIDLIGRYDPRQDPSLIEIDSEKAVEWLRKGAQPTEAVSKILDAAGALTQFKVKAGKIHTIGAAGP